jgi:hypothetical protein
MKKHKDRWFFFLGGDDLEMVTIRELLVRHAPGQYHDRKLSWGARASDYRTEIEAALIRGDVPVLVELAMDLPLDPDKVIVVDHHGEQSGMGKPTALEQVFKLLRLSSEAWTRWHALVAANDRGYIPELLAVGATPEEIRQVRSADRAAQGVTPKEETQAERAVAEAETTADDRLTVVRLPHRRTSAAADRLERVLGGPGYENLLVLSPDQVNFFGVGEIVVALDKSFPGGWYGGGLPDRGFWGHGELLPDVLPFLCERLSRGRD